MARIQAPGERTNCDADARTEGDLKHQTISFIKSGIRILGFAFLTIPSGNLLIAALLLIAAEIVGILEEVGHE